MSVAPAGGEGAEQNVVGRVTRWGLACGLTLLAACSSTNAVNTGPFGGGGDPSSLCVPVGPGGVLSYGLNSVDVFYRAAGQEYHLPTTTRIKVLAGPACA